MKLIKEQSQDDLEFSIGRCQKDNHTHQVAYSTYHTCLTQVCFTCNEVRTSMSEVDLIKSQSKGKPKKRSPTKRWKI